MKSIPIVENGKPWLDIFKNYILLNKPTVFKGYTESWPALKDFVTAEGDANFDYLISRYGDAKCPVVNVETGNSTTMSLLNYVNLIKTEDKHTLYLKDWHFQQEFGVECYKLPPFLKTDWANNERWTNEADNPFRGDYRFMYFGWKDTWTPFHSDVMSSHSWSANICGRKLWYFVPIGKEAVFRSGKDYIKDIRQRRDLWEEAGVVEIIQNPGEIVFVPSNWYHQVHNIDTSISLNHNSINSSNVYHLYDFLLNRLEDVKKELIDLRSFLDEQQVKVEIQNLLAADTGMNFIRFRELLNEIVASRSEPRAASCFICSLHEDLRNCLSSRECMERFSCACSCIDDTCPECLSLLWSYELSTSIQLLSMLDELSF